MIKKSKLGIILNPEAGRGKARRIFSMLPDYLRRNGVPFHLESTNAPGHAQDIAKRMKNNYEIILAAGGDGTLNEVTEGMAGSKTALAVLPIGSGNDFNRMIRIPKRMDKAINTILNGKKKLQDLGQIYFWNSLGEKKKRLFINTLGIGLDAEIADETKNIKWLRGLPLYLLAAFKALKKHSSNEYRITAGKKTWSEKAFLICIGNGCFEGGGFNLLPQASLDDSLLDMCLIKRIPVLKAVKLLPALIKGTHAKKKSIIMHRIREISIESKTPFVLHSDGEILDRKAVRVKIELATQKLYVIKPA